MNSVQILNKFKAPGNVPQGLSGVEMALWMILVEKGEKRVYGIPVLDALETGMMKSFIAVKLRDENGKEITESEPISVACLPSGSMPNWWTYSGTIYVGFSDKKIRTYNPDMSPKIAYGTSYYYTATQLPDGLYSGTTLYYCSAGPDAIFSINTSTGVETREKVTINGVDFDVISRRLAIDGISTDNFNNDYTVYNYTTRKYSQDSTGLFSPTAISQNFLCSASLNKIAKRETSIGQNFINTIPTVVPVWTNEQTTPVRVFGISEVADYSVPENSVIYLSGEDGNIYKCRFKSKEHDTPVFHGAYPTSTFTVIERLISYENEDESDPLLVAYSGTTSMPIGDWQSSVIDTYYSSPPPTSADRYYYRRFGKVTPPSSYVEAIGITRSLYYSTRETVDSSGVILGHEVGAYPISSQFVNIVSYNEVACSDSACWKEKWNSPASTLLWNFSYDGTTLIDDGGAGENWPSYTPGNTLRVVDITSLIPTSSFWFMSKYNNESQNMGLSASVSEGRVGNIPRTLWWSFLTDNGSLTILDQFIGKSSQRGIHIGYKIPYIKIAGQSIDGYMKKSGTTYNAAISSTPAVTKNGETEVKYVGTRLTGGTYEIYRSYLSFDTKFIDFTPGVIHLYLDTITLTTTGMEILVYEMPAHVNLTADKWGQVGRLLARKRVCALNSIFLPLDTNLSNGIYVELRGSQESSGEYIQNDLVTIGAYELRIFS